MAALRRERFEKPHRPRERQGATAELTEADTGILLHGAPADASRRLPAQTPTGTAHGGRRPRSAVRHSEGPGFPWGLRWAILGSNQ